MNTNGCTEVEGEGRVTLVICCRNLGGVAWFIWRASRGFAGTLFGVEILRSWIVGEVFVSEDEGLDGSCWDFSPDWALCGLELVLSLSLLRAGDSGGVNYKLKCCKLCMYNKATCTGFKPCSEVEGCETSLNKSNLASFFATNDTNRSNSWSTWASSSSLRLEFLSRGFFVVWVFLQLYKFAKRICNVTQRRVNLYFLYLITPLTCLALPLS